ncbi:MAG TPA: molybdopterin converting factor subunit 1 [Thermoanaerobaculia bacterium]|nr:molybdopterin converting factor subunit 1 [Thermoanaerobaculia bacterium]
MQIRLLLFAVLREVVGSDQKPLELEEGTTAAEVWERLRREHPRLAAYDTPPMVAVNQEYADPATPLRPGDELAFIPPVSGG